MKNHTVNVNQEDVSDTIEVSPFVTGESAQTLSDTGWVCKQAVITTNGYHVVLTSDVTVKSEDDLYYLATLEPEHTAVLDVDQYLWIIEITNSSITPKYRRELKVILSVDEHNLWNSAETSTVYDILDYSVDKQIKINSVSLPVGLIKSVKLLDDDNNVLQTGGWESDSTDIDGNVLINLLEPVKVSPTKLMVNI